ncbi:MAG: MlaE family lipid ABC transporter permease subunit [Myxococcota bacterium]
MDDAVRSDPPRPGPGDPTRPSGEDAAIEVGLDAMRCRGDWTVLRVAGIEAWLARGAAEGLTRPRDGAATAPIALDCGALRSLDTAGAWLLHRVIATCERTGRVVSLAGLRPEHAALLEMVAATAAEAATALAPEPSALARLGETVWRGGGQTRELLVFVGEVATTALRSLARPARIRWRPILYNVRSAGFDALPITGLLVFLMGIVIAYQGASQLRRYGANIFVADLVGLAMLRELSPLLTAIIVAGRSGSAYAAQIGTMKVTEEVDALRTVGIPPLEQLVLPKLVALTIALPLLTVYADMLGVAGGMVMAKSELDVGFADFLERLQYALVLSDFLVGIGKAPVFAGIISIIGCFQGFRVAGDAESVGHRTTVSVVQSIFAVIVADAIFSIVFNRLGI